MNISRASPTLIMIGLFFSILIFSEYGVYLWHRYAAHEDWTFIKSSHEIHHLPDSTDKHAHSDFIYLLSILIISQLFLGYFVYKNILSFKVCLTIVLGLTVSITSNYFIHSEYHNKNSVLNNFETFKNMRKLHFEHHKDDTKNYGIITHYPDRVFNTFSDGAKGTGGRDAK